MQHHPYRELDAILRNDFICFLERTLQTLNPGAPYLHNWHIDAIAYRLSKVTSGDITRLIINLPPRHLKSTIISVAYPAFVLGHDPRKRIFCISYGSDLSTKHAADFRAVVESDWYRRAFPKMRIARATDSEIQTTARGFRKSTSINAALTGLGGNLFIIDDPQKPVDAQSEILRYQLNQWFSNTLISRLDNKQTSAIVVVMQRVHLLDLSGYLIDNSDDWDLLSLSSIAEAEERVPIANGRFHRRRSGRALHPQHESLETIDELRAIMAPDDFNAQYQQAPVPLGGAMIKRDWITGYSHLPERRNVTKVIISLDSASKTGPQNDWSVFTVWYVADGIFYLVDFVRDRFEYPMLRATMAELANRYKPTSILIEDSSSGPALAQDLKNTLRYRIELVPVHRDKISRVYVQQAKFATHQVRFPLDAPFMRQVLLELLTFPQCKTDDIVDSIMQALEYRGYGYDFTYSGFQD